MVCGQLEPELAGKQSPPARLDCMAALDADGDAVGEPAAAGDRAVARGPADMEEAGSEGAPEGRGFEKVTADGGVLKRITRQGAGGCPPLHARCWGENKCKSVMQNGSCFQFLRDQH